MNKWDSGYQVVPVSTVVGTCSEASTHHVITDSAA